jgi:hypothetical protein
MQQSKAATATDGGGESSSGMVGGGPSLCSYNDKADMVPARQQQISFDSNKYMSTQ